VKTARAITKKEHQTQLNINLEELNKKLGMKTAQAVKPSDMGLQEIYTIKIIEVKEK